MEKYDLEEGKISVRISCKVERILKQDMEDFCFFHKNRNKINENAFYNKILPSMIIYRNKKRKNLREYLENNFSNLIKDEIKGKFFYYIDDIFDYMYFNDFRENYHNERIHFRLNKKNILELKDFFNNLKEQSKNKTSYIRNLLNEYSNMNRDIRMYICFNYEYMYLENAIEENSILNLEYRNKNYIVKPYSLLSNIQDDKIYLIGVDVENNNIGYSFCICELKIKENFTKNEKIEDNIQSILDEIIESIPLDKFTKIDLTTKEIIE